MGGELRQRRRRPGGEYRHRPQHHGEHHVAGRSRQRHQRQAVQPAAEFGRVRPHRPAPADEAAAQQRSDHGQDQRAQPVHVRQRVQRQPALEARGVVAQPGGDPGVSEFVRRRENPQQQHVENRGLKIQMHVSRAG